MERRKREADLVVIGRGLVALMASGLAAESGMRVVLYRTAGRAPVPDHDWFHSGLLLDTDLPTAKLIRVWGRHMLRRFGIGTSTERGIFLTRTDQVAEGLRRTAARLAVPIDELSGQDAMLVAGPHFSQFLPYAVPDTVFDKVALSDVAQECCVGGGAANKAQGGPEKIFG
jgi:hypothetical protein